MKKKLFCLLALALCLTALLCACGKDETPPATTQGDPDYRVTVLDGEGEPYATGVIVRFCQNGTQVAMVAVDDNGDARKQMPAGEYTVELMFTDSAANYYYDTGDLTLTVEKTELTITLYKAVGLETVDLPAAGQGTTAYRIETGGTYVPLNKGTRNYFLFTPTEAGTYEFTTSDTAAVIGYYGAPHFVQKHSAKEVADNKFTVSVSASMIGKDNAGTTVLVVGVDSEDLEDCILFVRRIGDPEHTLADEPWAIYKTTVTLAPYTLPDDAQLCNFDLTAANTQYTLVFNEADGFFHLNTADGPLVLVRLGKNSESQYLDPFEKIVENSSVCKYFYDENGNFLKKESYDICLLEYIANMYVPKGVYPLTKDLQYIIQQRADHAGWFDTTSATYLFKDGNGYNVPGINPDLMWLFMCCYIAE